MPWFVLGALVLVAQFALSVGVGKFIAGGDRSSL
jgi:hypothetical protein